MDRTDPAIDAAPRGLHAHAPRWALALALCFAAAVLAGTVLISRASPYYVFEAGPAVPLAHSGSSPSQPSGHGFAYTTVQVRQLTWSHYWWTRYTSPSTPILTSDQIHQDTAANTSAQMRQAKATAAAVAQNVLTGADPLVATGAQVTAVLSGQPAAQAGVKVDDVITAVDGTATPTATLLLSVAANAPTGPLDLTVTRSAAVLHLTAPPAAGVTGRRLGIRVLDATALNASARQIPIDSAGVTGPSGGLMFTLATIDAASPGDLTGGHNLAGTGTIAPNGAVGPIGGANFKIQGAQAAGATVFFVPESNVGDARAGAAPGITVVPVDTVAGALAWLCQHGATDHVCTELPLVAQRLAAVPATR